VTDDTYLFQQLYYDSSYNYYTMAYDISNIIDTTGNDYDVRKPRVGKWSIDEN